MTDDTTIRFPVRRDAATVRELAQIAHPRMTDEDLQFVFNAAYQRRGESTKRTLVRHDTGATFDIPFLTTIRVLSRPYETARAFIYCAPPLDWIIRQGRPENGALSIEDRSEICATLAECELLATLPNWRGRGYAGQLLDDAEDRYRAAGYRAMMIIVNRDADPRLRPWYGDRGYAIGDPNAEALIQLWGDRMHQTARYGRGLYLPGQAFGIKALNDDVSVTEHAGRVHVRGLLSTAAAPADPVPA